MTFGIWRWWGRQPYAPAAFTSRKCSWYSFSLGVESTQGPWYSRKENVTEKSSDTNGNRSRDRLVAQRLNHYAIPGPSCRHHVDAKYKQLGFTTPSEPRHDNEFSFMRATSTELTRNDNPHYVLHFNLLFFLLCLSLNYSSFQLCSSPQSSSPIFKFQPPYSFPCAQLRTTSRTHTCKQVTFLFHSIFTSETDGREWSAPLPSHFCRKQRAFIPTRQDTVWVSVSACNLWRRQTCLAIHHATQSLR